MSGAVFGAVLSLVGGIAANSSEKSALRKAAAANKIKSQQQSLTNAISRRDQIRAFRIQRAQAVAASSTDYNTSSLTQGALGSIDSQAAANINYLDYQENLNAEFNVLNRAAGKYMVQASSYQALSQAGPAIGQLAGTVYNSLSTPKPKSNTTPTTTSGG